MQEGSIQDLLLIAVAMMGQHIHIESGVPGDPDPHEMLRDWKSYASRCLNRLQVSGNRSRWWTEGGSKRKLKDERAVLNAAAYIRDQEHPLVIWIHPNFLAEIGPRRERDGK